jgi:hypothetical protein
MALLPFASILSSIASTFACASANSARRAAASPSFSAACCISATGRASACACSRLRFAYSASRRGISWSIA